MDIVLKLLAFIISSSLVQSGETIKVWKSIKLNEKMIYDCVDIYKQPSLNHPLLQNHKIQMKPSFPTLKSKYQLQNIIYGKIIDCPNGTVPILKNTKAYVANAQHLAKKHYNPVTVERHGEHIVGIISRSEGPYYGVRAMMSVHDLIIESGQSSYTNIYVGGGVNSTFNVIEFGWMVNPDLFGDGRTWSYGYWKGANGVGCYNTICPGFVQVSKSEILSGPLVEKVPPERRNIFISIHQDKISGNWWAIDEKKDEPAEPIGYWPKEMFDLIRDGADKVGVGGVVHASPSGKSPPMGNGHLPNRLLPMESARVAQVSIMDSSRQFKPQNKFKFELLLDSKCYGFKTGYIFFLFTYGGPGGSSCGI